MITVVTSAGANIKFTELATLKVALGITDSSKDAILNRLIDVVSDGIPRITGKVWAEERVKETIAGTGDQILMVSRTPVTTIHAIKFDGSTVDATTYSIEDPESGLLYRESGWKMTLRSYPGSIAKDIFQNSRNPGSLKYEVEYTGGWVMYASGSETLLDHFENQAIEAIRMIFKMQDSNRDPMLKSEKLGDLSKTFRSDLSTQPDDIMRDLFAEEVRVA